MVSKNTICLWYEGEALEAARFYAQTFPDSAVGAVHHAPGDYPSGKQGDVLTVEFTVMGIPCLGLNGGQRENSACDSLQHWLHLHRSISKKSCRSPPSRVRTPLSPP